MRRRDRPIRSTFPRLDVESANVFYIALPDPTTGACAAGTRPVWRFFNQRTTNHRYTTDQAVRDDMRSDPATWTAGRLRPGQRHHVRAGRHVSASKASACYGVVCDTMRDGFRVGASAAQLTMKRSYRRPAA